MNINNATILGVAPEEVPGTYREMLKKVNLSSNELKELGRLSVARPIFDLTATMVLMAAAPFAFAGMPGVLTAVLCVLIALHNFNCLASIVHASDHGYLFENPAANNAVGMFCAYLIGYTRTGHRLAHQAHHSYLNTERDSDNVWGDPSDKVRDVAKKWVEDLFFVSAIRRILQYSQSDRSSFSVSPWRRLNADFIRRATQQQAPVIPIQIALLAYFWVIAGPYYYFLFHLLPLLTVYPALIRLRTTVEHSFPATYTATNAEQRWITRTTKSNWLERFVIAPLDSHYHFEHHLLPAVPYYNLAKAHALITSKGFQVPLAPGYFSFVFRKWRLERQNIAVAV